MIEKIFLYVLPCEYLSLAWGYGWGKHTVIAISTCLRISSDGFGFKIVYRHCSNDLKDHKQVTSMYNQSIQFPKEEIDMHTLVGSQVYLYHDFDLA